MIWHSPTPPYYSGFRIATHFLVAGRIALRPGGKMLVVTKTPDREPQNMTQWFEKGSGNQRKGYHLFQGVRPRAVSSATSLPKILSGAVAFAKSWAIGLHSHSRGRTP